MQRRRTHLLFGISLSLMLPCVTHAQVRPEPRPAATPEAVVTAHARGTFDVTLSPQDPGGTPEDSAVGRLMIDKRFRGDLEGTSRGQMLTAMTAVEGSAGYVAIERVSGTLHGRAGTFMLQHSGTMDRGAARLVISVVPDSGTGELVGLTGEMEITIAGGKHSYDFAYTLPGAR
jgi:Protein of unknown function (DUF3224)